MSLNLGHIRVAFPPLLVGTTDASLVPLKRGRRADSYRLTFRRDGGPRDLLVKHFRAESDHARREMASCRIVADLNVHVVPPLIALHERQLLVVTRFLPDARDLMGMIVDDDVQSAMKLLGRSIATLISTTCLDYSLNSERDDPQVRVAEADALAAKLDDIVAFGTALGASDDAALRECLTRLLQSFREPLRVSWTQGDPAPTNVLFTSGRAWLIDFEYGAWRHALHDLAQWFVRAPLPDAWYSVLSETVAESVLRSGVYADRALFRTDLGVGQSHAALYMLGWLPAAEALNGDRAWVGTWTVRDALIAATARGAHAARGVRGLERLGVWFAELNGAMQAQWPDRGNGEPDWRAVATSAPREGGGDRLERN
jgi:hypothetical protein